MIIQNNKDVRQLKRVFEGLIAEADFVDATEAFVSSHEITYEDFIREMKNKGITDEQLEDIIILKEVKKEDFMNNPYLKNIDIQNETVGKTEYSRNRIIKKNTVASFDEDTRDLSNYILKKKLCYVDRTMRLPMVHDVNSNVCYMSIEPSEINSLAPFINAAHGNVLICGLGLGYTAYMLSIKDNVDNIVILENNKDVIELFNRQVLPHMDASKITIVECDANTYIENSNLSIYDYINVDLWYDVFDMVYSYTKCKTIEDKYPNTIFTYWLENNFLIRIQTELMYYFVNGEYRSLDKDITEIVKGIVDLTDGVINENNYDSLFSIENIKSKIKMWGLQNEEKLSQMKLNEPSKRRNYTSAVSSIINEEKSVKRLIKNK